MENVFVNSLPECIKTICNFVRIYHENILSPSEIFESTNYRKFYKDITLEMLSRYIKEDEDIVNDWLRFTQDKRWTPAWGIDKISDNKFLVYYVPENGGDGYRIYFSDKNNACAFMIIMEMEGLRLSNK